jgi:GxxExxY protein
MNTDDGRLNSVTRTVIGCAYRVANTLGCGFLEKVYENALAHEIRKAGLLAQQQCQVNVLYDDIVAGEYVADLLVERCVLVELKAAKTLERIHLAQCLNYLKGSSLRVCLLINFGTPKVQVKRISN